MVGVLFFSFESKIHLLADWSLLSASFPLASTLYNGIVSSIKILHGEFLCCSTYSELDFLANKHFYKSEPDIEKNGTPASPAVLLLVKFYLCQDPLTKLLLNFSTKSTKFFGSFKNSTISSTSLASSTLQHH